MSRLSSRLSTTRYMPTKPQYHSRVSQLFPDESGRIKDKSEILPQETLPRLLLDFKKLFDQSQTILKSTCDVVIKVKEESQNPTHNQSKNQPQDPTDKNEIHAHRQLLMARSSVLEKLLALDSNHNVDDVKVTSVDNKTVLEISERLGKSAEIMKEVVEYIYWGKWEPNEDKERTVAVFRLAYKFDLKELRNAAGNQMITDLTPENAASYLLTINDSKTDYLIDRCIEYIIEKRSALANTKFKDELTNLKIDKKTSSDLISRIYRKDVEKKSKREN